MTEEQRSPTGKPMVEGTPMDVIHVRIASFALVFCFAVLVLSFVGRIWVLTGIVVAIMAIIGIYMAFAVRRQKRLGGGPQSRG
ncbi:hypothetical protein [Microbispora bryophytorum]|uniref:Uncharacterized protein n=1 Tax=Microbispora bryophytorum TaxID=1460882 RepID=A0A8H9H3L7_9ACTN|nr:hypothetical protein [Microbispora bryophytorum]MBD3137940.1 hypothetical protein [Microbispora bryophytorum]TQS05162.1 hypothetical protein FLX07_17815 [Microbispora bryophytorum]GGO22635.1 hypothetical protein GCM10011574_51160 [Microbispora bryophytorum]